MESIGLHQQAVIKLNVNRNVEKIDFKTIIANEISGTTSYFLQN